MMYEPPGVREAIAQLLPDADIVAMPSGTQLIGPEKVDMVLATPGGSESLEHLLRQQPDIEWIHVLGTGIDGYPSELFKGKKVTCSKGATAVPIAEWVIAMMLAHAKSLPSSWIKSPPAQWYQSSLDTLEGKTLGIVGFGEIGQAIARRALAFDMKVICTMRTHRPSGMPGVTSIAELDELISVADHLVLALPASSQTSGMINAQRLSIMKRESHLINVSRAALIDQNALHDALDRGIVARASLDVVDPEPLPQGHWLYEHPSVFLSPHISWNSPLSIQRMIQVFLDNLSRWAAGQALRGEVDTNAGY
ncbi:MAG: dihydrofolate reductase [Gammaproteobacteria bacterium]|nr:dihydrofolate reductase [Gammaproteobacteria bacterium]